MIFPATMADLVRGGYVFLKTSECKACGKPVHLFRTPKGRVAPFVQGRRGFYIHFAACPAAKAAHEEVRCQLACWQTAKEMDDALQSPRRLQRVLSDR